MNQVGRRVLVTLAGWLVLGSCSGDRAGIGSITLRGRVTVAESIDLSEFQSFCTLLIPARSPSFEEVCRSFEPDRGLVEAHNCGDLENFLLPLLEEGGAQEYSYSRKSFLATTSSQSYSRWRTAMWLTPRADGRPKEPWILGFSDWAEGTKVSCAGMYFGVCYAGHNLEADVVLEGEASPCPP
jgi:hypothetical protein